MAIDSNVLLRELIQGGLSPHAAKLIVGALEPSDVTPNQLASDRAADAATLASIGGFA